MGSTTLEKEISLMKLKVYKRVKDIKKKHHLDDDLCVKIYKKGGAPIKKVLERIGMHLFIAKKENEILLD